MEKQFNTGNAQIFKNPFLERLTKTSPLSNIVVYGIVIIILLYVAFTRAHVSAILVLGLFAGGVLFWTFAEYILHRYVFHWVSDSKWSKRLHFVMHGAHHDFPKDKDRLLMPPVPGLIMAGMLFLLFYAIFWLIGLPDHVYGFFAGFFVGYLMYSFVHRSIHVRRPPKRFKHLWLHHNLHHFKYPDKAFGVSSRFWDRVFRTLPPEKRQN